MNNHPGRKNMRTYLALAMTVAAFGIASTAHAQTYPSRPVRWIVPFAPGGSQDVLVRVVAPELSTLLATPVLVDNKAGAGGSLAMLELTKAAPDGYTVSIGGSGTHAINPHLYPDIPFNPTRDHAFVAPISTFTNVLLVNSSVPARTAAEFVAYSKANPGKINFGSGGTGTSSHLSGEAFKALTGAPMLHVSYKGINPALTAVMSGEAIYTFSALSTALPHVKSGRMRALAVTSRARSAYAPDIPTMQESGVADYDKMAPDLWKALFVPTGTPRPVIERLRKDIASAIKNKAVTDKFYVLAEDVWQFQADEFPAFLRSEIEKWGKVVKIAGVKGE